MVRTVCSNEDEHSSAVLRNLKEMKHEKELCDFTIKVESKVCHAHRNILAASSSYFRAMFKYDTKERQEGIVVMEDVDFECVESCIHFMYSGKFNIPDGKITDLLHVAIMLQLDEIEKNICKILEENLTAEKFYQTRNIAEMYSLSTLERKCKEYQWMHFMAISSQPEFEDEKRSHLVCVFKLNRMKLTEHEKLTASLRWIGKDSEKKEELLELLKCINLKKISSTCLSDLLDHHPFISNDLRLYKLISEPLIRDRRGSNEKLEWFDDELVVFLDREADCLQSYNPLTEEVSRFHNDSIRQFHFLEHFTTVTMDTYIYILGGNLSVHRLNYIIADSEWERMQNMLVYHGCYPPSVVFSGSLYVIGGGTLQDPKTDVEKLDPATTGNQWVRMKSKPVPSMAHALVSLGDSIYTIGGYDAVTCRTSRAFCKFTPSAFKWTDLEPMKIARRNCGAVAFEQKIYVMGGRIRFGYTNAAEYYDIALGQWSSLSPMIQCHGYMMTHLAGGSVFVTWLSSGGKGERYDIKKDRWSKVRFKRLPSMQFGGGVWIGENSRNERA